MEALKCVNCGAPLPEPKEGEEYVKCEFCGYVNRISESADYMEKLKMEVMGWLQSIVPAQVISSSSAVDAVSRHNIFVTTVKPNLLSQHLEASSKVAGLISMPMLFLPFWDVSISVDAGHPKEAFEGIAKLESLKPLAVVDEDARFLNKVIATQYTYAYFSNFVDLLKNGKKDPKLLANNFKKIREAFENVENAEAPKLRFEALYRAYMSIDAMMSGDVSGAMEGIRTAIEMLERSKAEAAKNPEYIPMVPAIEKEIRIAGAIESLVDGLSAVPDPMEGLMKVQRFFEVSENARKVLSTQYHIDASDFGRYRGIMEEVRNVMRAKAGEPAINVIGGPRELMLPFWRVQLTYTFTTGSLFWKKGKAITDELLILATVPYASRAITDIFKMKPKGGMFDGFLGKEASMTTGYLRDLMGAVRRSSVSSGTKIVPPLITSEEAKLFSDWYIGSVARATSGKVKFGVSRLMGIVYLGAEVRGDDVFIPELKEFQVSVRGHLRDLMKAAL